MNNEDLNHLRHSTAHLLAAAVMKLWPDTKRAIGPAIEDGFYYDFEFSSPISEADFPKIEKTMKKLLTGWRGFEQVLLPVDEARKEYKDNPYKQELIDEFSQPSQTLSFYKSGDFIDLCKGGHLDDIKQLKHFKLLKLAGAYWRGDEKNKMLTRIYGTAFPSKAELDQHLVRLEEAKQRDHRKIGKDLELFAISEEVGPGLVLWLPRGQVLKESLETWAKDTEREWGYQRVSTPNITKSGLFYTSGHLPYYKDDMYPPMKLEGEAEYFLKPMNCPHHHMIYATKSRSYRDLPLRLAEYGTCYRYEASGELFGLMRVRGFTQNDAHIYCTEDQAVDEFVQVMKLHEFFYQSLGITDYHLVLALRDPKNKEKYHGDESMWQKAEELMRSAVAKVNIPMVEEIGSAAFYGPKIDFVIHSSIGRQFAISTNQIDLYMGQRFGLKYTAADGSEQTPVIIHRAPLGSHERFIGFLIEHFNGSFPVWLSPTQAAVLPVSEKFADYAQSIHKHLLAAGVRSELDASAQSLGKKIRNAEILKVPYVLVVGEKEVDSQTVAVRRHGQKESETLSLEDFTSKIKEKISNKALSLI